MNNDLIVNDLPDYLEDGTIFDDHGNIPPASVVVLHNNIIRALRQAWPKRADTWRIVIDTRGGIVQVYNTAFSGQMGFVVHILKMDTNCHKVVEMAGELFERYGIATNKGMSIKRAMADMKVDPFGRPIYEK